MSSQTPKLKIRPTRELEDLVSMLNESREEFKKVLKQFVELDDEEIEQLRYIVDTYEKAVPLILIEIFKEYVTDTSIIEDPTLRALAKMIAGDQILVKIEAQYKSYHTTYDWKDKEEDYVHNNTIVMKRTIVLAKEPIDEEVKAVRVVTIEIQIEPRFRSSDP